MSVMYRTDMTVYLMMAITLAGFVGFSRLSLDTHTPPEVYSGFLLGFSTMVTIVELF
jgi:hypothetical protein